MTNDFYYSRMKPQKDENKIIGNWILKDGRMTADSNCERINWLRANYITLISTDDSGWLKLYQDPIDKRYWQLEFPYGEMHGGGPPSLILLSGGEAKEKFKV